VGTGKLFSDGVFVELGLEKKRERLYCVLKKILRWYDK
jgi:hypothetical protein